jgi:hypothetical protein
MWCPFRTGTWCFGLEETHGSQWTCKICETAAFVVNKRNARPGETPVPVIHEEDTQLVIPESRTPARSNEDLFECHYQSPTHRRCVDILLKAPKHGSDWRSKAPDFLDPFIENLTSHADRAYIGEQMYWYLKQGHGRFLASALTMLHGSMQQEIRSLLTLMCCKQLSISLARMDPFDSPTAFVNEEEIRSFPSRRQDAWKQHKTAVLAGGDVGLIVSLVLSFLPEFVPTEFPVGLDDTRQSKRPRVS